MGSGFQSLLHRSLRTHPIPIFQTLAWSLDYNNGQNTLAPATTPSAQSRDHLVSFSMAQAVQISYFLCAEGPFGCSHRDDGNRGSRKRVHGDMKVQCWLSSSGKYSPSIPPWLLGWKGSTFTPDCGGGEICSSLGGIVCSGISPEQHSVRSLGANKKRPALASIQSQAPETGRMNCQYQLLVLSVLLF